MTMDGYFEKRLLVNNRRLTYKGIFVARQVLRTIQEAMEQNGYEHLEKRHETTVTEVGKRIYVEYRPRKIKTNYATLMIKIKIQFDKVTSLVHQGTTHENGEITVAFDAWTLTDYRRRWGQKPWAYFFKGIINKYIYRFPLEAGFSQEVIGDTAAVYGSLKQLFRTYTPIPDPGPSESDIRSAMQESMDKDPEQKDL